jgi:Uma2 family endonuclease
VSWASSPIDDCNLATEPDMQPTLYPDSDGRPIGEDTLHFDWIVRIEQWLESLFYKDPNVFVAGDLLWYPVEGDPTIRTGPDAMVAFGRPKGDRGSYKQWEEGNIAPQVVFEVLPTVDRFYETLRKFQFYERYGVDEFYIYKPDTGHLEGWRRVANHFEEVPEIAGFVSPRLGIRFEPGEGRDNLKIVRPDGKPFLTYSEAINELRALERLQRDKGPRVERYASKLRELGIEPD